MVIQITNFYKNQAPQKVKQLLNGLVNLRIQISWFAAQNVGILATSPTLWKNLAQIY